MARFGLWVAALSLLCFVAVVASDSIPVTGSQPEEDICGQFMNEGSTMTVSRVFDMIAIKLRDYIPDFNAHMLREFMQFADSDHDDRLNQSECENLVEYIKHKPSNQQRK